MYEFAKQSIRVLVGVDRIWTKAHQTEKYLRRVESGKSGRWVL